MIIGTRGSALALWQAEYVKTLLEARYPDLRFELRIIRTEGDEVTNVPLASFGSRGVFVKEIQNALLAGQVDLAVHSLKDLPSQGGLGLMLAAVPEREDARDVLISRHNVPLAKLPKGAMIGTSSPRRSAQIKAFRSDFVTADLRGNLDTRLNKAGRGDYDGVVLAAAGIHRLGLRDRVTEYLSFEVSLPAGGQGALAIEARADDGKTIRVTQALDHGPTRRAVNAERACLRAMNAGCQAPLGVFGEDTDGVLRLRAVAVSLDGCRVARATLEGPATEAVAIGERLAGVMLSRGAAEIVAEARQG